MSSPGAVLEWVASDGRKGALTGRGKSRGIRAALSAAVAAKEQLMESPEAETTQKLTKTVKKDKKSGKEPSKATSDVSNDSGELERKKPAENEYGFTDEQDKTIMRMKNDKPDTKWDVIAEATGKKSFECKERFQQIKPDGWKPANVGKGKKGGEHTENQSKGKNKPQNQNQSKQEKKKEKETADAPGPVADDWGTDPFALLGDTQWDASGEDAEKDDGLGLSNINADVWNTGNTVRWADTTGANNDSGGDDYWFGGGSPTLGGDGWGVDADKGDGKKKKNGRSTGGNSQANVAVDTWGNSWNADGGANDWAIVKDDNKSKAKSSTYKSPKSGSKGFGRWSKTRGGDTGGAAPSEKNDSDSSSGVKDSRSKSKGKGKSKRTENSPRRECDSSCYTPEYYLRPDETFSFDDLKLVARILQSDSSMVWERLSWRFRDKTGRNLPAAVFEKKITEGLRMRDLKDLED